jgi:diguanylate cyclase (GGDEF)-like protein/PAS domain S-box-containing protein
MNIVTGENMDDNFYEEILNSMRDGIYYLDRDRVITYWNQGAEKITGYTSDQVIGKSCRNNILNHVNEQGLVLCKDHCPMAATMQDGMPREVYVYLHHAEGHRVPVQIRSAAIRDQSGNIVGAVETFNKGISPEQSDRRIRKLQKTALLDPLTAIGNRRHLESRLKIRMTDFRENQLSFGLLFCDLDQFKDINDTYGHNVGDQVLRMVAQTLRANIRESDTMGRWGGEEFLVILRDIDVESLHRIGEKLLNLVRKSHLALSDRHILSATISIGGTLVQKNDTIDSVIDRADRLMYQSKANGRNRITIG